MIPELRLFLSLDWTTLLHVPASILLAPFRLGPPPSFGRREMYMVFYLGCNAGAPVRATLPGWPQRGAPQHEISSAAAVIPLPGSRHLRPRLHKIQTNPV